MNSDDTVQTTVEEVVVSPVRGFARITLFVQLPSPLTEKGDFVDLSKASEVVSA